MRMNTKQEDGVKRAKEKESQEITYPLAEISHQAIGCKVKDFFGAGTLQ